MSRELTNDEKIDWVGNTAAEDGDPDVMALAVAVWDGDEHCRAECLAFWDLWAWKRQTSSAGGM